MHAAVITVLQAQVMINILHNPKHYYVFDQVSGKETQINFININKKNVNKII